MRTIWKYQFKVEDTFSIKMPRGSKVLSVQVQYGFPCMWVEVQEDKEVERTFKVYGTGHYMQDGYRHDYVGTFQMAGGALVFHLYEINQP